jgi:LTXXQ motif family protein
MSAPERLDRMETMMTGMLESVRTTKAATTPLYAVLTDEQKKLADDLIWGPMGVMGPMM